MTAAIDAPASAFTAPSPVVLPTAEDKQWAASFEKQMRLTFRAGKARTALTAEMVRAVEGQQLWRLNHLITTAFTYGVGRTARADLNSRLSVDYDDVVYKKDRELLRKYPEHSSVIGVAIAKGFGSGVKLLAERGASPFSSGVNYWNTLRDLVTRADAGTLLTLISKDAVQDENARSKVLGALLQEAVTGNQIDLLKAVVKEYPAVLQAWSSIADSEYPYTVRAYNAPELSVLSGVKPAMTEYILSQSGEAAKKEVASGMLLRKAIAYRNEEAAIVLINAGSPVTEQQDGYSPLMGAAKAALPKVVAALFDKGAAAPFAETIGPELLKTAVSTRGTAITWGAIGATAELIMNRLPVSAFDIRELLTAVPPESIVYTKMKAQAFSLDPNGEDMGAVWRALGTQQAGIVTRDKDAGLQLTEIFNFATSEHMIVSRNLETKADTILLRESFEKIEDKKGLQAAEAFLAKRAPKVAAPKTAA